MNRLSASDRRRHRRRMRPTLTALEDRRLLSTIVVDNPTDAPAMGKIDLRQAIGMANTDGGGDTITFKPSVFSSPQTITLGGSQLELTGTSGTTTIIGPAGGVTVSGGGASRVFQVDKLVAASISGLTITGGKAGYDYGGGLSNLGTTSLTNCTVSGNSSFFGGGGVANGSYSNQGPELTLINCTVSGNTGGGLFTYFGTTTATNTIIAGNDFDLSGALDPASTDNLIGGDPLLAPLGIYGGTGETMALLPGSPAIDAGTGSGPGIPTADERGVARPQGTAPDIGAFESSGFTIAAASGSGQTASGAFSAPLVATVVANNKIEPVAGGLVTFTAPTSGASATISGSPAVIAPDGTASVTAASNFIGGSYTVSATAAGAPGTASFGLTNDAVVSIAVSPGNPSLAVGVSGQFIAMGTFTDHATHDITNAVAWSSATPSVATIGATGVASGVAVGKSQITASLTGVMSPVDTLTVIAPSFVVNTAGDAFGFYSGTTSLREAIAGANVVPGRTITFDRTVFNTPQTIPLGGTQLELSNTTGTTTITGPKAGVTVSGGGKSRVFLIDDLVTASISGLTISDGNSGHYGSGGGVLNDGTVTLTNCTIKGSNAAYGNGGGMANFGTATLTGCTVDGNTANGSFFSGNGGGLFNGGTATLTNCTISGNSGSGSFFSGGGGGVANGGFFTARHAMLTMTGCTLGGNSAYSGGGLYNGASATLTGCTINGNAASYGTGGGVSTGSFGNSLATTKLAGCTISGNSAAEGGGVSNDGTTALTNCTVSGNSAAYNGGGVLSSATPFNGGVAGTVTMTNCTVSGNSATNGGGVFTEGGIVAFFSYYNGQSYYNVFAQEATTILNNCTVSGNSAAGDGGGLATGGAGTTSATNTTVSGNSAVNGGGVSTDGLSFFGSTFYGTTNLTNGTVSGNSAVGSGGGLFNTALGTTTVTGTIVKSNSAAVGGGIANQGTLNVASSNIINNQATSAGGGISTTAGTATITYSAINTNLVVNPSGTALGGGIDCENSTLTLINDTVNANRASGKNAYGGGIYALGSTVNLQGCTVNGNQANGTVLGDGGGIYGFDTALTLVSTTVKGNKATTVYNDLFDGP